jgi:SWI/SNF-related matrix-associated actin-dependent regulator 1 of chromatin subfamily A
MKPPDLYGYQKIGVFRATHKFKGRVLFSDEVGLGKSAQSLHTALHYKEDGPIVIACPNSIKFGWEIEVHKHAGLQSWILNGLKPPLRLPLHIPPVIILNWDILRGGWTDRLILLKPSVVIGDEITAIKGNSQRTKAFRRLCYGVPTLLFLSGTPIENGPIEFFNALNLLRKDLFPAFRTFAFRYSIPKVTPWGIKFHGSCREPELNKLLLDSCMIRRTKDEVLKELPPLQRIMVPLEIDRKEYEEAEKNFLSWLFKQNPGKAMKVKNAVHIAKLSYLLGLIAKLKTPAVIEWIEDFLENTNKKLVVFGHHRNFLENLHAKFSNQSVLVYGGIAGHKRQAMIDKFAADKKTKIFLGSITATGSGINKLQTVCSDMVIAELIWTGMKLIQAEGRLHRLGQKNPVSAYYLVAENTTESLLCKVIHAKQASINAIVDGKPDLQEFDVLESMFKQLRKKSRITLK